MNLKNHIFTKNIEFFIDLKILIWNVIFVGFCSYLACLVRHAFDWSCLILEHFPAV